jgi:hypothetical protein
MRRLLLASLLLCFASLSFGQVDYHKILASKTYDNNTKTVYLELNGVLDAETADMIESALESQPDIHKFSFYAAPDYQKCMFTSDTGVSEDVILALMNELVYDVKPTSSFENEFAHTGRLGDYYKVVFDLNRLPDNDVIQAIHLSLKESDFITDVNYRDEGRFEIFAYEPMYPDQVNQLLEQYDVKISQASITQK